MLGDENWMPSPRSLFAIIFRVIRRNPGIYKLKCMLFDGFETLGGDIIPIFLCLMKGGQNWIVAGGQFSVVISIAGPQC